MKFTDADALIIAATVAPPPGMLVQDIYWRVDTLNHATPDKEAIQQDGEKGLQSGFFGYSNERITVSPESRNKIIEFMRSGGHVGGRPLVAAWLNDEFGKKIREVSFELIEEQDDSRRYGLASIEWRVFIDGSE